MTHQIQTKKSLDPIRSFFRREEKLSHVIATNFHHRATLGIISAATELGSSLVIFVFFVLWTSIEGISAIFPLFLIYLFQVGIVELLKFVLKRPRPSTTGLHHEILGIPATSGSFPSGHTSNICSIAVLLVHYYALSFPLILIPYALVLFVGISRIYLGKHYIFDVLGGLIIGYVLTVIGISVLF